MSTEKPYIRIIRRTVVDDKVFEPAKDMLLIMAREIECGLASGTRILDPVRARRLLQMAEAAKRQYGKEIFSEQN